ncbi:DoxX-like family protein [Pseudoalteromonas luteoviolacea]|uniref:DoxX-like family protein n=1 Tax=Pseudoalteromonas luteoviolacea TaxID=43657 RepID=UPI001B3809D7|nr:DoxX-like family protein [Pseudoalteromonas luteoviolacea]MBQ4812826.1 DoxX-like family protein [Pseudoalteromonas luteoviolacea]
MFFKLTVSTVSSIQLARYVISFAWLYHGIFPKLVHVAPLESLIMSSIGFSNEVSLLITRVAGIGEVIFGVFFFIYYQTYLANVLNIVGLTVLLASVAVLQPQILIEAFNPVTTNIPLVALSLVLINHVREIKVK